MILYQTLKKERMRALARKRRRVSRRYVLEQMYRRSGRSGLSAGSVHALDEGETVRLMTPRRQVTALT